jgi:hypothetical protein
VQHTLLSVHSAPQMPTSAVRTSSVASVAGSLSGHGSCGPNSPSLPQFPRIAHRPASCIAVRLLEVAAWTGAVRMLRAERREKAAVGGRSRRMARAAKEQCLTQF